MKNGLNDYGTRWQDGNFNYASQVNTDDWIKIAYASAYSKGQTLAGFCGDNSIRASDGTAVLMKQTKIAAAPFGQALIGSDDYLSGLLDSPRATL